MSTMPKSRSMEPLHFKGSFHWIASFWSIEAVHSCGKFGFPSQSSYFCYITTRNPNSKISRQRLGQGHSYCHLSLPGGQKARWSSCSWSCSAPRGTCVSKVWQQWERCAGVQGQRNERSNWSCTSNTERATCFGMLFFGFSMLKAVQQVGPVPKF